MILRFSVSILVFAVEGPGQTHEPAHIVERFLGPQHTGVFRVGGFVRCVEAFLIEGSAEDLDALQDHLHHVLVAVIAGAFNRIQVKNEDIQFFFPSKPGPAAFLHGEPGGCVRTLWKRLEPKPCMHPGHAGARVWPSPGVGRRSLRCPRPEGAWDFRSLVAPKGRGNPAQGEALGSVDAPPPPPIPGFGCALGVGRVGIMGEILGRVRAMLGFAALTPTYMDIDIDIKTGMNIDIEIRARARAGSTLGLPVTGVRRSSTL